jgi:hypothetical protein
MDKLLPHQNLCLDDIQGEIWKDIKGYEGYYQISSFGRIKSLSREIYNNRGYFKTKIKILKQFVIKDYCYISISYNQKKYTYTVHRLVAKYFIDNIHNKPQVNHKNSNSSDNRIENLEWVSSRENECHKQSKNKNNTSVYTGVTFNLQTKKWRSSINFNKKFIFLGYFNTQKEAYKARCDFEKNNNVENKYL